MPTKARTIVSYWALALVLGCERQPAPATTAPATKPPPAPAARLFRLVDSLGSAEIDTPLARVPAIRSLSDLGEGLSRQSVLQMDFDAATVQSLGWRAGRGCAIERAPRPDGGRALHYLGREPHNCKLVIAVEPRTDYRIVRSVLGGDSSVDLRVIESRVVVHHPRQLNHPDDLARALDGNFVGLKQLVSVHRFPASSAGGTSWRTDEILLLTAPETHSLVILVQDPEAQFRSDDAEAWFDDVRVERLLPNQEQLLSLLKSDALAEGADPKLGMVKHGQLLPVSLESAKDVAHEHNYDYRYAILAPAPTQIRVKVDVPRKARFRLSLGMHKASHPGDRVTFQVTARAGERGPVTLLERTLVASPDDWVWHEASLPLGDFAGQRVELTLSTSAPAGSRGLALWGNPAVDAPRANEEPPNVLLVAVDTLRADRLSSYGYRHPTSPHLDALAAQGVRFANVSSTANWTSPAFASLFTGVMPSRHQVIHRTRAIAPSFDTLAERLRRGGWQTYGIAYKAYLYNMGFEQGFDDWFNVPRFDTRADDNLARAREWLDDQGDRRFFLFLHFNDPHQPFNQPESYAAPFAPPGTLKRAGCGLPITIDRTNNVRGCRASEGRGVRPEIKAVANDAYDGEVAYVDDRIGKLFDALKARGIYDDTLIVFVADHGEILWDRANYFGHAGPHMTDDLLHVPLIIKPPRTSGLATGHTVTAQVSLADAFATILDLVGLPVPQSDSTAQSLVPLMREPSSAVPERPVFSQNLKQHLLAIRFRGQKYVLHYGPGARSSELLFDLGADPGERTSVASSHPADVRRMRRLAADFFLMNGRGQYLLVVGDGRPRHLAVTLASDLPIHAVTPIVGLPLAHGDGSATGMMFSGEAAQPLVLLARVDAPEKATLKVGVTTSGEGRELFKGDITAETVKAYDGDIDELLAARRFDARGYRGAPLPEAQRKTVQGKQLEALKALGYIQ